LDALPARGQPPDGANRPRPEINPEQGRWLQKRRNGVGERVVSGVGVAEAVSAWR